MREAPVCRTCKVRSLYRQAPQESLSCLDLLRRLLRADVCCISSRGRACGVYCVKIYRFNSSVFKLRGRNYHIFHLNTAKILILRFASADKRKILVVGEKYFDGGKKRVSRHTCGEPDGFGKHIPLLRAVLSSRKTVNIKIRL